MSYYCTMALVPLLAMLDHALTPAIHNTCLCRYILRRTKYGFQRHAAEKDPAQIDTLVQQAQEELEILKRQSVVYSMYGRKTKGVMVSCSGWCL